MTNIHVALEIGTTRTVLAVGEGEDGGRLKIVHAEIPSTGVRKSQILDISQARESIRSVLAAIEKKLTSAGETLQLGNAVLVISGQHVKSDSFPGTAQVNGPRVAAEDVREVAAQAHSMPLPKDRELLDIVDRNYTLDSLGGISEPIGMAGRILKLDAFHIHADKNRVADARTAAEGAHLEIREPLFAATCAADAVLEEHERKNGVLVLDLGGGSTGYAVYSDGALAAAGVVGLGGDHISNDIAHAFQTTHTQAEQLKIAEASALIRREDQSTARVPIPGASAITGARTISRRALDTVVNARVKEMFDVIAEILEEQDLLTRLHAGVVLTGGGAALRDIAAVAEHELGMPARYGRPLGVDGLESVPNPASDAAIAGALLYANRNFTETSIFESILQKLFK